MGRTERNRNTRRQVITHPHKSSDDSIVGNVNRISDSAFVVTQKQVRNNKDDNSLLNNLREFIADQSRTYYMGLGGTGDALLTLAACSNDPRAKIAFFANNESLEFIREFFILFGLPHFLRTNIIHSHLANKVQRLMQENNLQTSGHLADNTNYGDWNNEQKYINRIVSRTNWIERFGTKSISSKPMLILGPSGSVHQPGRQRYLMQHEYNHVCTKYTQKGFLVCSVGSEGNFRHYGLINHDCCWLTSQKLYYPNREEPSNLHNMLQIIHSAQEVLSVDTFLKTYTLLVGKPTSVIKTRWHGNYKNYGEDITDRIFLNQRIWSNLKMITYEELRF